MRHGHIEGWGGGTPGEHLSTDNIIPVKDDISNGHLGNDSGGGHLDGGTRI